MTSLRQPGVLGAAASPATPDHGTLCRAASPVPGPSGSCHQPLETGADEALAVIAYIVCEMNVNSSGDDARRIAELNASRADECIAEWRDLPLWRQLLGLGVSPGDCVDQDLTNYQAAVLSWALLVRQDGPWDHKPHIRGTYNARAPGSEQVWHRLGGELYYYDIWSNIHYGYVGAACGFSESALLDGAGTEQIVSDVLRGGWPRASGTSGGMRRYDDPSDRAAITIGISLWQRNPDCVDVQDIVRAVTAQGDLTRQPFAP